MNAPLPQLLVPLVLLAPAVTTLPLAAQSSFLASGTALHQKLGLERAETVELALPAVATPGLRVPAHLFGGDLVLVLEPWSVRAAGFEVRAQLADGSWAVQDSGPVRTVRGVIEGLADSSLAGALLDDGLHARLQLAPAGELYWIEPADDSGQGVHVLYRGADVLDQGHLCGVDERGEAHVDEPETAAVGAGGGTLGFRVAELGCDADREYYQTYGSSLANVQNRIESIINAMNVQYETQLDITHRISVLLIRTVDLPNFYSTTSPGTLLGNFRDRWRFHEVGLPEYDVAQLFTGKNLDGSVIGIAYNPGVCTSRKYSVVQNLGGSFGCLTDLSAHELGHNWSANHCSCTNHTMNPSLRCANVFNAVTLPQIQSHPSACVDRECLTSAAAVFRNAGSNPASLTVGLPVLGTTWSLDLDVAASGHTLGTVLAYTAPGSVLLAGGQTFLASLAGPELLALPYLAGPLVELDLAVPTDASLCGLAFTCQGVHVGGAPSFVLSNAYDCVLGGS